ncbi:type IX secretion system membrane protein PorP/SprF [Marinoscillum sp. MHG1-6]|uniref:PorP/SprF family type IX secretion system membrane protein n=1 Tax=Marinoscillum sp. MHG1-6 TaxID=2959627 RepID=UPI0021579A60|nr:type IX secretion system membrane protein PorP/SprF [Marinoscillum sp. MHG1-6]
MKTLRSVILLTALLLASAVGYGQQRALTSTYPFNGLLLNPAYAGSLNVLSVIAVHRAQWINIEGAPVHQAFTAHNSFMSNQVGVGLAFTHDKVGVTESFSTYASYAYKVHTSFGVLAMGLQGGFDQRRSDFTSLSLLDESDPLLNGVVSKFSPNVGLGVYFANPHMWAGAAVPWILENKTMDLPEGANSLSKSRESRYYYVTGGVIFPVSDQIKLSPSVLIRKQEQNRWSYEFTGLVIFEDIAYAGLGVRNSGEIVFLGQLILNENFRVGYAYDAATSDLGGSTTGSHEIIVNYRIKLTNYKKHPQCPVYF